MWRCLLAQIFEIVICGGQVYYQQQIEKNIDILNSMLPTLASNNITFGLPGYS
jgi:hypothetical protein